MIRVKDFNELCKRVVMSIEISGYVITSTDEQTINKIKDRAGIQLVAVYPGYTFEGDEDSYKSRHDLLFFIILKPKTGNTVDVELQEYGATQDAMIRLKDYLFAGGEGELCRAFPNIDVNSVIIDPEYNIFGGYNGWSMKLSTN